MQRSLNLAREVQQSFIPPEKFKITGFDIAGKSYYCDQTGGDYYDIFTNKVDGDKTISIVIGDVSGHGISSALLMASVRSALRLRKCFPGNIDRMISDVNYSIYDDLERSDQFISMFYLRINVNKKELQWVRAGHDPGYLYDPVDTKIKELKGRGVVLGINKMYQYDKYQIDKVSEGQVIVLFTDGLWEAHNSDGEMFGKKRLKKAIQEKAHKTSKEIINHIIKKVDAFFHF